MSFGPRYANRRATAKIGCLFALIVGMGFGSVYTFYKLGGPSLGICRKLLSCSTWDVLNKADMSSLCLMAGAFLGLSLFGSVMLALLPKEMAEEVWFEDQ